MKIERRRRGTAERVAAVVLSVVVLFCALSIWAFGRAMHLDDYCSNRFGARVEGTLTSGPAIESPFTLACSFNDGSRDVHTDLLLPLWSMISFGFTALLVVLIWYRISLGPERNRLCGL